MKNAASNAEITTRKVPEVWLPSREDRIDFVCKVTRPVDSNPSKLPTLG